MNLCVIIAMEIHFNIIAKSAMSMYVQCMFRVQPRQSQKEATRKFMIKLKCIVVKITLDLFFAKFILIRFCNTNGSL